MEKSFKLIKIPLNFTGLNVYEPNPSLWLLFRRLMFFTATSAVFLGSLYYSFSNKDAKFTDRLLLGIVSMAYFAAISISLIFWKNKEKQVELIEFLAALHKRKIEEWMEPLLDDSTEKLFKLSKYIVFGSFANSFLLALAPVFVPGMQYIYPMEILFVNDSTMNHHINFGIQTLGFIEAASIYYIFPLIFFIFTLNLLNELEFIARLCDKVGNNEELHRPVQDFNEENTLHPNILKAICDELSTQSNEIDSKKLLSYIIEYHADALKFCDMINNIFASNILNWEAIFVIVSCLLDILILFDPVRAFALFPILSAGIFQYFFISLINSKVYEGMSKIAVSLYGSKWYLLNIKHRKDVVWILMMGQKAKSITVGFFGFSNLERFQKAVKVVYQACLVINHFIHKDN